MQKIVRFSNVQLHMYLIQLHLFQIRTSFHYKFKFTALGLKEKYLKNMLKES